MEHHREVRVRVARMACVHVCGSARASRSEHVRAAWSALAGSSTVVGRERVGVGHVCNGNDGYNARGLFRISPHTTSNKKTKQPDHARRSQPPTTLRS